MCSSCENEYVKNTRAYSVRVSLYFLFQKGITKDNMDENLLEEPAEMPEKTGKSFSKGFFFGVITCLICCIIGFGIGIFIWMQKDAKENAAIRKVEAKINTLDAMLSEGFLYDMDAEKMEDGIYKGFVSALDDPYTVYYTAEEYQKLQESNTGKYYGIGVSISQNAETKIITVVRVFRGSGAEKAGILPGDLFSKVDGEDITSEDINNVVAMIRGEEGTTVEMEIYRPSTEEFLTMTVDRGEIKQDMVEWKMLEDGIGYIQLLEFSSVTHEQFQEAMEDLKNQGMKGLVLDVRDNPGGLLDSVVDIADDLLGEGVVVSLKNKNGEGGDYTSDAETLFDGPISLLVNGNSASASEVLTGALKDYGRATSVGTQTYGKGIVQNVIPLGDGTALKMTIASYYSPKGINIHGTGIEPDIVIEYENREDGTDNQLEKAVEVLKEKM